MRRHVRLGVNIDHVATVRNARGGPHPDPFRAAQAAVQAGADLITAHLREDRRHIRDEDVLRLCRDLPAPLNLEIAASPEMVATAIDIHPPIVCLVPERREERTTEGGLDTARLEPPLAGLVASLRDRGIKVTLFIEPDPVQVAAAHRLRADAVEFHTGRYCELTGAAQAEELGRIAAAAADASRRGLDCHAGHGLTFANVGAIAAIAEVTELNIGHFLVGEAVFVGLAGAILEMRRRIDDGSAGRAS
jgi:pyridoxine 5-phosphate synthase